MKAKTMIIYPAIDLRRGQVVRLQEGDPNRQTTFSNNPLEVAQMWQAAGATWLHMVNLDGAFGDQNTNLDILGRVATLGLNVQFGGGLRTLADIERVLTLGAKRAVLGTVALQNPDLVTQAVQQFGSDAICVALDSRDGKVATHGWQTVSEVTPTTLGQAMFARGVRHALYTDISRDGALSGVNVTATVELARATGLQVIASGGVSHLEDIHTLASSRSVAGAIIGMALYTEQFTLQEALNAVGEG